MHDLITEVRDGMHDLITEVRDGMPSRVLIGRLTEASLADLTTEPARGNETVTGDAAFDATYAAGNAAVQSWLDKGQPIAQGDWLPHRRQSSTREVWTLPGRPVELYYQPPMTGRATLRLDIRGKTWVVQSGSPADLKETAARMFGLQLSMPDRPETGDKVFDDVYRQGPEAVRTWFKTRKPAAKGQWTELSRGAPSATTQGRWRLVNGSRTFDVTYVREIGTKATYSITFSGPEYEVAVLSRTAKAVPRTGTAIVKTAEQERAEESVADTLGEIFGIHW